MLLIIFLNNFYLFYFTRSQQQYCYIHLTVFKEYESHLGLSIIQFKIRTYNIHIRIKYVCQDSILIT